MTRHIISKTMARRRTGIEWADFTVNHWTGCTRVPASSGGVSGCEICYAETLARNRLGVGWGPGARRMPFAGASERARKLDAAAAASGRRFSVFSLSLGDWLDPEVPEDLRAEMLETVETCRNLDWLLLTHRPHLARKLLPDSWLPEPPDHVWPGVTVDHAAHAFRWSQLRDVWPDCPRLWVSIEPILSSHAGVDYAGAAALVVGGASNTADPRYRPDPEWIRELIRDHPDTVFFKQWGIFDAEGNNLGDKRLAGREIDGRTFDFTPWPRNRDFLAAIADGAESTPTPDRAP